MAKKFKIIDETLNNKGIVYPPGIVSWNNDPVPVMLNDTLYGYVDNLFREDSAIWANINFIKEDSNTDDLEFNVELKDVDSIITASDDGDSVEIISCGEISNINIIKENDNENHSRIALVASGSIPVNPPKAFFENPKLTEPTMLTVTKEGRIFGHVAAWKSCHIGYLNQCVQPPRSRNNYQDFNRRPVETAEGEIVYAGPLTFGVGHASLVASAKQTKQHYDNVNAQIGQIVTGEDEHGIWFSGALNPDIDEVKLRKLKSSAVSGDWRRSDLQGVLVVNIPGFPIPRAEARMHKDQPFALVAAGVLVDDIDEIISEGETMTEETPEANKEIDKEIQQDLKSTFENLIGKDPEKVAELRNYINEAFPESKKAEVKVEEPVKAEEKPAKEKVITVAEPEIDPVKFKKMEELLVKLTKKVYK